MNTEQLSDEFYVKNQILKPSFFIIGFPKCGTTSLSSYLASHPDIYYPRFTQEPMFWNSDFLPRHRKFFSLKKYLNKCYSNSNTRKLAGESSPNYIYSDTAVRDIVEFNPQAKFIVLVRNISEMLTSWHSHLYFKAMESEPDFKTAWRINKDKNIQTFKAKGADFYRAYGAIAKYSHFIEKARKYCDDSNIIIVCLDNLKHSPRKEYLRILNFLGIDDDGKTDFSVENARVQWEYSWQRILIPRLYRIKEQLGINTKLSHSKLFKPLPASNSKKILDQSLEWEIREHYGETIRVMQDDYNIKI